MMKKIGLGLFCICIYALSTPAQTFVENGQLYPLHADGDKYTISGFIPVAHLEDDKIYANALLWIVEHICPKLQEGITEVNVNAKSFSCELVLAPQAGSGLNQTYYCQATFRIADSKLIYYISDIRIESATFMGKKLTPMESLTPEKKPVHKQTLNDFVYVQSHLLNRMFDYVTTNRPSDITHWKEIAIRKPVAGMTEDECRLAFGKPQAILEANGETQWMYSSFFYLFFKDGHVQTIVR